ncbi:Acyl-CoA thioester hydrolase/BAAT N-terminal region [Ralstonia sp. 25mfcol4.1]|uniref:acyl-CoA thioesterase/bile acid-CoA:amino acid N-acyltransferase family protein n=1 Tax=Ralstonia sp. 25mfcol4.1 TaxID=1761899 RepID=UPI00041B9C63|nr:acyl-CoA thioesterase/bile acid-CoA:amino acid N-acyltransferase family protein [Ralstonia sp. 25mfcol4.1]SDP67821.1 Acyl-CoA thioester hydrolase/BAAT N-terminal region [Ralstonia sp. 25mfcol4.1]
MTRLQHAQIDVEPADALVDVPREITLRGFNSGERVTLTATLHHPDGSQWESHAVLEADADGTVPVGTTAPASGGWIVADATAPVWAMWRLRAPTRPALSEGIAPLDVALTATGQYGAQARAQYTLRFLAPGVTHRPIREAGLSGTLYTPAGPRPHPAVLVLAGSGGGTHDQRAALYAAHGYSALALGYFKTSGRPEYIDDTPLEYFESALRWMHERLAPQHGFVAVSGVSRGGELVLLLGSRFPALVSAIVAYVPSAVVHGTLRAGHPDKPRDATAWTWRGEPLPNVWQGNPDADWHAFDHPPAAGQPVRQAAAFHTPLRNPDAVARARIPVENIEGPVLLISGTDDGFWPSTLYSDQVADVLRQRQNGAPVEHFRGEGAGHAIGLPQLPATLIAKPHPVAGLLLDGGGTAQANATASAASWARVVDFLADAVQRSASRHDEGMSES